MLCGSVQEYGSKKKINTKYEAYIWLSQGMHYAKGVSVCTAMYSTFPIGTT